jgi:hypothetical protein
MHDAVPLNLRQALVVQPFLERAVEAFELAQRLRVRRGGVDQLDADRGEPARSNATCCSSRRPVNLVWLSESSWRERP